MPSLWRTTTASAELTAIIVKIDPTRFLRQSFSPMRTAARYVNLRQVVFAAPSGGLLM